MGACPKIFGKVLIVVVYVKSSMETWVLLLHKWLSNLSLLTYSLNLIILYFSHYKVAQETLQCYLKTTKYEVAMVDLDNDQRVKEHCSHHNQVCFWFCFSKKTSLTLEKIPWKCIIFAAILQEALRHVGISSRCRLDVCLGRWCG